MLWSVSRLSAVICVVFHHFCSLQFALDRKLLFLLQKVIQVLSNYTFNHISELKGRSINAKDVKISHILSWLLCCFLYFQSTSLTLSITLYLSFLFFSLYIYMYIYIISLYLFLSLCLSVSFSLSFSLFCVSLSLSLSLSLLLCLSLCLFLSVSVSLSFFLYLSLSLSHSFSVSLSGSFSLLADFRLSGSQELWQYMIKKR